MSLDSALENWAAWYSSKDANDPDNEKSLMMAIEVEKIAVRLMERERGALIAKWVKKAKRIKDGAALYSAEQEVEIGLKQLKLI